MATIITTTTGVVQVDEDVDTIARALADYYARQRVERAADVVARAGELAKDATMSRDSLTARTQMLGSAHDRLDAAAAREMRHTNALLGYDPYPPVQP